MRKEKAQDRHPVQQALMELGDKRGLRLSDVIAAGYSRHWLALASHDGSKTPSCVHAELLGAHGIPCEHSDKLACTYPWHPLACAWSLEGALQWLATHTPAPISALRESLVRVLRDDYYHIYVSASGDARQFMMNPATDTETFMQCIDAYYDQATLLALLHDNSL